MITSIGYLAIAMIYIGLAAMPKETSLFQLVTLTIAFKYSAPRYAEWMKG